MIGFGFGLAVLAVLYWLFKKANAAQNLNFSLGSPVSVRLNSSYVEWIQNLNVTNGESSSIVINAVNLKNYIGTSEIGSTILFQPTRVAAKATSQIPLNIQIPYNNLYQALSENITGIWAKIKGQGIAFKVVGTITAEQIPVKISQNFNLKI